MRVVIKQNIATGELTLIYNEDIDLRGAGEVSRIVRVGEVEPQGKTWNVTIKCNDGTERRLTGFSSRKEAIEAEMSLVNLLLSEGKLILESPVEEVASR